MINQQPSRKKQRRRMSGSEGINTPNHNDVLCGRGAFTYTHIGNRKWRQMVLANKRLYCTINRRQKTILAESIVIAVGQKNPPGRFLKKNQITTKWHDVGRKEAIKKTSQALREGAPTLKGEMKKEFKQRNKQMVNDVIKNKAVSKEKETIMTNSDENYVINTDTNNVLPDDDDLDSPTKKNVARDMQELFTNLTREDDSIENIISYDHDPDCLEIHDMKQLFSENKSLLTDETREEDFVINKSTQNFFVQQNYIDVKGESKKNNDKQTKHEKKFAETFVREHLCKTASSQKIRSGSSYAIEDDLTVTVSLENDDFGINEIDFNSINREPNNDDIVQKFSDHNSEQSIADASEDDFYDYILNSIALEPSCLSRKHSLTICDDMSDRSLCENATFSESLLPRLESI